jgi:hypothetical protein
MSRGGKPQPMRSKGCPEGNFAASRNDDGTRHIPILYFHASRTTKLTQELIKPTHLLTHFHALYAVSYLFTII